MNIGVYLGDVAVPRDGSKAIRELASRRAKFFGKHGERFDRRLYAEIESIIRLYIELDNIGIIENEPKQFKKLLKIQRDMLKKAAKSRYESFP